MSAAAYLMTVTAEDVALCQFGHSAEKHPGVGTVSDCDLTYWPD